MSQHTATEKEAIYRKTAQALEYSYKGYEIHKIIDVHLRMFIYRGQLDPKDDIFKNFLRAYSFSKFPRVKAKVLITLQEYMERKDYQEIFQYVKSQIKDQASFSLNELRRKWVININHIRTGLRLVAPLQYLSKHQRMQIAAVITQMLNTIDNAEKGIQAEVEKYVCFCSVPWMENLVTQYFNVRQIPTYDLQHGVTRIYHKNVMDNVEYANIVSSVHFTWGDYSRDEFLAYGFRPESVVTGGYPRQHTVYPLRKPAGQHILVFLSRPDFDPQNQELLQILARFNQLQGQRFRFSFKLHPSLSTEQYQQAFATTYAGAGFQLLSSRLSLSELFKEQEADLCIVANTSCYYECYMLGVPTLRYYSDRFDMEHAVTDDLFSDTEGLEKLMDQLYHHFEDTFPQARVNEALNYVLGLHCNEYARILNA